MKNLLVLPFIFFFATLSLSPVFAQTEATIPNSSFEKWSDTAIGFLPTKWQVENGSANNVARSNRTWGDGAYSVQLSGVVTLSSAPFDYTGAAYKLSANSISLKGGTGMLKLFTHADGIHPVCKMAIPQFQTKICIPPFPQSSRYYISISQTDAKGSLIVDNVSLVEN